MISWSGKKKLECDIHMRCRCHRVYYFILITIIIRIILSFITTCDTTMLDFCVVLTSRNNILPSVHRRCSTAQQFAVSKIGQNKIDMTFYRRYLNGYWFCLNCSDGSNNRFLLRFSRSKECHRLFDSCRF